ncbi:hypothetical protein ACFFKU_10480 [Kineococcus gynurae]|uniref:Gas vesicle protein GvpL/GvpF n=1 Tax=Kineococcus gynurae TaxID=452979 RepID=A0ABV5LV22_9ACTN
MSQPTPEQPAPAPDGGPSTAVPSAAGEPAARARTVVLTEEALGAVDVGNIAALRDDAALDRTDFLVLVPADTERSVLVDLLDHLSLGELREALHSLRGSRPDPDRARADASTALEASLAALRAADLHAEGRTTDDDPLPALREVLTAHPDVQDVVVVTRPHAVEDTFHRDWASRARDAFGVPVLHLYAGSTRLG